MLVQNIIFARLILQTHNESCLPNVRVENHYYRVGSYLHIVITHFLLSCFDRQIHANTLKYRLYVLIYTSQRRERNNIL